MDRKAFDDMRHKIKDVDKLLLELRGQVNTATLAAPADKGEVIANLTISHRKLEDAGMRVGKAIQALEGGVSIYDKKAA